MRLTLPVLCLILLHSPDGEVLHIDTHHIIAIRPAENVKQHLAHGINSIVYASGQNFGVTEMPDQVDEAISNCVEVEEPKQ